MTKKEDELTAEIAALRARLDTIEAKPDPEPPTVIVEAPSIAERLVRLVPEADRKKIEKEIMGLQAKLKWDHMGEGLKDVWRGRIRELEEALKG